MNLIKYLKYYRSLFGLGALSLAVQVASLRELLISLNGNEIIIGVFYSSWLLAVMLGAKLSTLVKKKVTRHLTLSYPLIALLTFMVFSKVRLILGVTSWEEINIIKSIALIIIGNLTFGILGGILFVKFINIAKEHNRQTALSHGYTAESLGSVFCGILTTTLLLIHIKSFYILLCIGLLFYYLTGLYKTKKSIQTWMALIIYLFSAGIYIYNDRHDYNFILETPFQELAYKSQHLSLNLYSNGKIISSYPSRYDNDALAALILSQSKSKAKKILISGLGQEELIKSLSYYDIELYYHVYDKDYSKHIYPEIKKIINLDDSKTNIINQDIRTFLQDNSKEFDAIIIAQNGPSILAANSYYSDEFFNLVRNSLRLNGIVLVPLEQEVNFLDKELALYGSSILMTLDNNFHYSTIIPGKTHYFIACNILSNLTTDVNTVIDRYQQQKSVRSIYQPEAFHSLFDKRRIQDLHEIYRTPTLLSVKALVNRDSRPNSYLLNNIVTMRKNNIQSAEFVSKLMEHSNSILFLFLMIFLTLRMFFQFKSNQPKEVLIKSNTLLFQALSGFTSLSVYLVLLYLFQIKFSQLYSYLGLLTASYMLGLCIGSISIKSICRRFNINTIFYSLVLIQIIFLFVLYGVMNISSNIYNIIIFLISLLFAGFLGGCSYPSAELLLNSTSDITTKYLEEYDYIGACIAGFSVSLFFMPFIGIKIFILFVISCWLSLLVLTIQINHLKAKTITNRPERLSRFILTLCICIFSLNIFLESKKTQNIHADMSSAKLAVETKDISGSDKINGYGGPINLAITLNKDRVITSLNLKENKETPYYIRNIDDHLQNYIGLSVCDSSKLLNVDAISGATITSDAILENLINYSAQLDKCNGKSDYTKKSFVKRHKTLFILALFVIVSILFKTILNNSLMRTIYLFTVVFCLGSIFQIQFSTIEIISFISFPNLAFNFITFIILLTILFGRHYCAFLCPFGALCELASKIPSKFKIMVNNSVLLNIKNIFLLSLIIVTFMNSKIFFSEPLNIFFSGIPNAVYWLSILIILLSIYIPRFWCKVLCPAGAFMSAISKISIRLDNCFLRKTKQNSKMYHCSCQRYTFKSKDKVVGLLAAIMCVIIILANVQTKPTNSFTQPIPPKKAIIEEISQPRVIKTTKGLKQAPIDKIKSMIQKERLSNKEARFYDKINQASLNERIY